MKPVFSTHLEINLIKKTNLQKLIFLLLLILSVIFLIKNLVLSYFIVPSLIDDFDGIVLLRTMNIFDFLEFGHNNWNGRFMGHLNWAIVLKSYVITGNFILYHFLLAFIFIFSTYLTLNQINSKLNLNNEKKYLIVFSIFIWGMFVESLFSKSCYYWASSSSIYFPSLVFVNFSLYIIFSDKNSNLYKLLLFLCGLAIGGYVESISVTVLFFSIISFLISFLKQFSIIAKYRLLLIILSVSTLISFLFVMLSPGTVHRLGSNTDTLANIFFNLKQSIGSYLYLVAIEYPKIIINIIIVILVTLNFMRKKIPDNISFNFPFLRFLFLFSLFFFCVIYILMLPLVISQGSLGELRTTTHLTYVTIVLVLMFSYLFNKYTTKVLNSIRFALIFILIIFSIFSTYKASQEIDAMIRYKRSFVEREKKILELQNSNNDKKIYLPLLYKSSYLVFPQFDISPDTLNVNYSANYSFTTYYNLRFKVYSEAE